MDLIISVPEFTYSLSIFNMRKEKGQISLRIGVRVFFCPSNCSAVSRLDLAHSILDPLYGYLCSGKGKYLLQLKFL